MLRPSLRWISEPLRSEVVLIQEQPGVASTWLSSPARLCRRDRDPAAGPCEVETVLDDADRRATRDDGDPVVASLRKRRLIRSGDSGSERRVGVLRKSNHGGASDCSEIRNATLAGSAFRSTLRSVRGERERLLRTTKTSRRKRGSLLGAFPTRVVVRRCPSEKAAVSRGFRVGRSLETIGPYKMPDARCGQRRVFFSTRNESSSPSAPTARRSKNHTY